MLSSARCAHLGLAAVAILLLVNIAILAGGAMRQVKLPDEAALESLLSNKDGQTASLATAMNRR